MDLPSFDLVVAGNALLLVETGPVALGGGDSGQERADQLVSDF